MKCKICTRVFLEGGVCQDCIDWKERVKDTCFTCSKKFNNPPKRYIRKGNMCDECVNRLNEKFYIL